MKLLICDLQERFRPLIYNFAALVHQSALMIKAAKILDIPIYVSEQNPNALGPTVPEIKEALSFNPNIPVSEFWLGINQKPHFYTKSKFSMFDHDSPELPAELVHDQAVSILPDYIFLIKLTD
jgi:hypothetical protein